MTIGIPPTKLSTQAVGVALLHQFARDRFLEAGLSENLIEEAEENLDIQACNLLLSFQDQSPQEEEEDQHNIHSGPNETSSTHSTSMNSENANITQTGPLNSTVKNQLVDTSQSVDEQFHSIINNNSNQPATSNESDLSGGDHNSNSSTQTEISNCSTLKNVEELSEISSNIGPKSHHHDTLYHSADCSEINQHCQEQEQRQNQSNNNKINLARLSSSTMMIVYGRELRQIAEEFAKSRQRQTVKEQADGVILENINKNSFLELLNELFDGGITREKIAVLFFFCTDVALRAASMASELVVKLLSWSFTFIINTVCKKVEELGGWNYVLFNRVPKLLYNCLTVIGICAMFMFLHRSLRYKS